MSPAAQNGESCADAGVQIAPGGRGDASRERGHVELVVRARDEAPVDGALRVPPGARAEGLEDPSSHRRGLEGAIPSDRVVDREERAETHDQAAGACTFGVDVGVAPPRIVRREHGHGDHQALERARRPSAPRQDGAEPSDGAAEAVGAPRGDRVLTRESAAPEELGDPLERDARARKLAKRHAAVARAFAVDEGDGGVEDRLTPPQRVRGDRRVSRARVATSLQSIEVRASIEATPPPRSGDAPDEAPACVRVERRQTDAEDRDGLARRDVVGPGLAARAGGIDSASMG